MPLQFDGINWNWDSATRGAKQIDLPIPEWSSEVGAESVCAECYAALTLGVEFNLRMSLNGWSVPTVDVFKLVPFGELSLASVVRTTLPLTRQLTLTADLLQAPLSPRPLVIPLGLLAITIRPGLLLQLEATAALSNPISVTLGMKQVSTVRNGVQLVAGKPLEYVRSATQTNSLVSGLTGLTPDGFSMHAIAGVKAELTFGVGLTLAFLALAPLKPLVTVGVFIKPQVSLGIVPATAEQRCTLPWGYAALAGMQVGATVSPLTVDLGLASFELTFGGALPYAAEFSAIEMQPPPGCTACTGCLGALDRLAHAALSLRGPTIVPSPLPLPTAGAGEALVVTLDAGVTSVAIGAPLLLRFAYPYGTASSVGIESVSLAVEVRQFTANSSALQTVVSTSEQLALAVPFARREVRLAALRPFTTLSLTSGVSKVRFVAIAEHSDDVFGKSAWLDVRAPTVGSGAPATRIVDGWSICSVQCGGGGVQTRSQTCVSGDGARITGCPAGSPLPLQRACSALIASCPFVPYSVLNPTPHTIASSLSVWSPQRTDVVLAIEFGGGQAGRQTRISACYADIVNPCATKRPPTCFRLLDVEPSARGSTRVEVELTPALLLTVSQPRPVALTLLFENVGGGADDWALSPAFVVRVPDMTYAFDGDVTFINGSVSVGGVFGAVVLQPSARYRRTTADIGYPARIALNVVRAGSFSVMLRLEFPGNGIPFNYNIQDYRKQKVPGTLVAFCEPLRACRICDAGDAWCNDRDNRDDFRQQLPPVCVGRGAAASQQITPAEQQCGTSGVAGVCQDSRSVTCPSPRRYVRNKCANTPAHIKCCPTLSQMALLEADGDDIEWDDDSTSSSTDIGAIVGGVVGGVIALGCLVALIVFFVLRRRAVVFDLGDVVIENTTEN
jgi:hypothetical protein